MNDCVSLEMARKLKEAGWQQKPDQTFWEVVLKPCSFKKYTPKNDAETALIFVQADGKTEKYAAPTIGELLEALPFLPPDLGAHEVILAKGPQGSSAITYQAYRCCAAGEKKHESTNPADALALLWIALKEKNLV